MFGDPHMMTLDGYGYTFNGLGEYVLTDVDDGFFILQVRMAQSTASDDQPTDGTVIVACAAQQNDSTLVQMTMNDAGTDFEILVNGSQVIDKTTLLSGTLGYFRSSLFSVKTSYLKLIK